MNFQRSLTGFCCETACEVRKLKLMRSLRTFRLWFWLTSYQNLDGSLRMKLKPKSSLLQSLSTKLDVTNFQASIKLQKHFSALLSFQSLSITILISSFSNPISRQIAATTPFSARWKFRRNNFARLTILRKRKKPENESEREENCAPMHSVNAKISD